ncbi:Biopolymer transport protein ExbB [compost metagenome]
MSTLAQYVDHFLFVLVALTVAVIVYKVLHLFAPRLIGRPRSLPANRRECDEQAEALESGMALLAVIASAAPFVGLAGTVMHIMEALSRLSGGAVDITLISGPIATALNSTLVGLASAVPALIAYNLLQRRVQVLVNRMLRQLGA